MEDVFALDVECLAIGRTHAAPQQDGKMFPELRQFRKKCRPKRLKPKPLNP